MKKIGFLNSLIVEPLIDGKNWKLHKTLNYYSPRLKKVVHVPKGFITDFASIPRPLWIIAGSPATGKHRRASIIHDYLLVSKEYPRIDCDKVFYEACRLDGVSWFKSKLLYAGLRTYATLLGKK